MNEFFLVSLNELEVNQQLTLTTNTQEIPKWNVENLYTEEEVTNKLTELYPDGVSKHGLQYLSERFDYPKINGKDYLPYLPLIELTFELIRKIKFNDKPSRFTCVFGSETLEEASTFNKDYRGNKGSIYKVSAEEWVKLDMKLLYVGPSILGNEILAEKYWKGESSKEPFWEVLMTGEIKVLEKISS